MPTLNPSKWGKSTIASQLSHANARGASSGTTSANLTLNDGSFSQGSSYKTNAGRGFLTYNIGRAFFYFDTSAATGTISNVTLRVQGAGSATADVIVVKSTAFGGDGSANLDSADFSNVNFSTLYSSEFTSWTSNGSNIDIDLNSTAETDIKNNDAFICAILQFDNDQQNVDPGAAVNLASGYRWSTAASAFHLTFTEAASSNITSLNGVARASITSFNTIALASIVQINGIDN